MELTVILGGWEMYRCQRLWSFFYNISPWGASQFDPLSHSGGFHSRCVVFGLAPALGGLVCSLWPGPGNTWSRWSKWSGSFCSQTHWMRSRRGTCGGSCGILRLWGRRTLKQEEDKKRAASSNPVLAWCGGLSKHQFSFQCWLICG